MDKIFGGTKKIYLNKMNEHDLIFVGKFKIINDEKKKEVKYDGNAPPLAPKNRATPKKILQ